MPPSRVLNASQRAPGSAGFLESRLLAQSSGLVGRFPGEVLVVASEVAVRSGLAVDRTAQVQATR